MVLGPEFGAIAALGVALVQKRRGRECAVTGERLHHGPRDGELCCHLTNRKELDLGHVLKDAKC
jgi:hypothetical protein